MPKKTKVADRKLTIIGGGIIGAMEAYQAWQDALAKGEQIRITINERYSNSSGTTAVNIAPSLTPDEILAVVPRGSSLIEKMKLLFSEPGGIRVDDVTEIHESAAAHEFVAAVARDGQDTVAYELRTRVLLELGKTSMDLWQTLYDRADAELQGILRAANFNPCREPLAAAAQKGLHDGYRIDIVSGIPDAGVKAESMLKDYTSLGYKYCAVLSPIEVMAIDPNLADFCDSHSHLNDDGTRQWNPDAVGLWRPGGCLDVSIFLPLFYEYLRKSMGQYPGADGTPKDYFCIKFDRNVAGVVYDDPGVNTVSGLRFFSGKETRLQREYNAVDYVFCPGEAVGTLRKFGFSEPAYAGFAGVSLKLNIPLSPEELTRFATLNHCMEVHREGVVLAWQARIIGNTVFVGVGGTKAFYGDVRPDKGQAFATERNLLQLNVINDVLPSVISIALKRDTRGETLTLVDLKKLEEEKIARRWVGVRAVAYDGFPTIGLLFNSKGQVPNARCTTGLGSGGVSFAPAVVAASRRAKAEHDVRGEEASLADKVLELGASTRTVMR